MRIDGPDGYWVSDDPALIDIDRVQAWIGEQSYWARGRPLDVMVRALENSLSIGLYAADGTQVGYARLVTDRATFGWLCDVFIEAAHRSGGLGDFLVASAVDHPDVATIRQVLMAEPSRTLYRRHGFGDLGRTERWLERPGATP